MEHERNTRKSRKEKVEKRKSLVDGRQGDEQSVEEGRRGGKEYMRNRNRRIDRRKTGNNVK